MNIEKTTLLNGCVELLQRDDGLRAGLDSVFLASAVNMSPGQRGLDVGCGVGAVGLCVLKRLDDVTVTGIEYQQSLSELASKNGELNKCAHRYDVINADFRQTNIQANSFDHVFMNPPFMNAGSYLESPKEARNKAIGHQDNEATLEEWINFGFHMIAAKGTLTLIHRADALQSIIVYMGKKFGALEVFPLHPKEGEPAKRIIIRATKHRKSPSIIYPGIVLHKSDGSYTDKAHSILRNAIAL